MAGEWPLSAHPSCLIPVSSSIFHGGGQGGAGDLSLSRRGTQPTLETETTHCQLFQNRIVLGILMGGCDFLPPPPKRVLGGAIVSHSDTSPSSHRDLRVFSDFTYFPCDYLHTAGA